MLHPTTLGFSGAAQQTVLSVKPSLRCILDGHSGCLAPLRGDDHGMLVYVANKGAKLKFYGVASRRVTSFIFRLGCIIRACGLSNMGCFSVRTSCNGSNVPNMGPTSCTGLVGTAGRTLNSNGLIAITYSTRDASLLTATRSNVRTKGCVSCT